MLAALIKADNATNTMWVDTITAGFDGKHSLPGEPIAVMNASAFSKVLVWERDHAQDQVRLTATALSQTPPDFDPKSAEGVISELLRARAVDGARGGFDAASLSQEQRLSLSALKD